MDSETFRGAALGSLTEVAPGAARTEFDLRGRPLYDRAGTTVGRVADLLLDRRDRLCRLLRVSEGAGGAARLVPVEAVTRITPIGVWISRSAGHVAATPAPGPAGEDRSHLEAVYAHYGCYPFWTPERVYPSFPVYRR